eukprot:m.6525 g.6525  ORF g.6525 m.6525 type:complete len:304 (+) comp3546_c0_seq1:229-1140(+)
MAPSKKAARKASAGKSSVKPQKGPGGSKPRSKLVKKYDSEDDEDGEDHSSNKETKKKQTGSSARSEKTLGKLTSAEKANKVSATVRFILFRAAKRKTVQAKDLYDIVGENYKGAASAILSLAQKQIQDVFGYELVQLPPAENTNEPPMSIRNTPEEANRHGGVFYVTNTFPQDMIQDCVPWGDQKSKITLTMVILGFVYCAKGEITDGNLWHCLNGLGIKKRSHPLFGNVADYLEKDMIQQKYLLKVRGEGDQGNPVIKYRWGQRARAEFSEPDILRFLAKIYDQDPDEWVEKLGEQQVEAKE